MNCWMAISLIISYGETVDFYPRLLFFLSCFYLHAFMSNALGTNITFLTELLRPKKGV